MWFPFMIEILYYFHQVQEIVLLQSDAQIKTRKLIPRLN
jgi:hypothetical protein